MTTEPPNTLGAIRAEYRDGQHRGHLDALVDTIADRLGVGFFKAQSMASQVRMLAYHEAVQEVIADLGAARRQRTDPFAGLSPGLKRAAARHQLRHAAPAYGGNAKFTAGW